MANLVVVHDLISHIFDDEGQVQVAVDGVDGSVSESDSVNPVPDSTATDGG